MSESSIPETAWPLQNNSLTLLKGFAMNLKRATENGKKKNKTKNTVSRGQILDVELMFTVW